MNEKKPTTTALAEREIIYTPLGNDSAIRLTITMVKHYLCTPTKSGKICSDRDAVRFAMLCKSRALDPFQGDAYLLGYDGKNGPEFSLITAHQAFLKRAELHPEFDGMESGVVVRNEDGKVVEQEGDYVDESQQLLGAWAIVHFKTRKYPIKRKLALKTFNKEYSRWQVDPAGMIVKCAEADALRSAFPTKLGGMYLKDEVQKADSPTLTGGVEIDLPPAEVSTGQPQSTATEEGPTPQTETSKPYKPTPQSELAELMSNAAYSFTDLQKWLAETGNYNDADSLITFDDIPTKVAERLLRAKNGLLFGLQKLKGGT